MIERDAWGRYWVLCPKVQIDGGLPVKINISNCLSCDYICESNKILFDIFINRDISINDPKLNLDRYNASQMRGRKFCIQKTRLFKPCTAKKRFCIYNEVCPNKDFGAKFKFIRQKEVKDMYALKIKGEKEIKIVDKKQLAEIDINTIAGAYEISNVLRITNELVPYTQEGDDIKEEVKTFIDKYGSDILTIDGKPVKLKSWFISGSVNDTAFVINNKLKPVKKVEYMSLKRYLRDLGVLDDTAPKKHINKKEEKVTKPKRKRRTKAEMAAARAAEAKLKAEEKKIKKTMTSDKSKKRRGRPKKN